MTGLGVQDADGRRRIKLNVLVSADRYRVNVYCFLWREEHGRVINRA